MLDKSVPYASLRMHRKPGVPIPEFPLPPGFRYTLYNDGDERDWARIETSVGEFDSEFAALMYFKKKFVPESGELRRRLVFVETGDGLKVATANAWWSIIEPRRRAWLLRRFGLLSKDEAATERRAWIHWVAVDAQHQGLGLGKAVVAKALQTMREIEGDVDMYLSTQTWSYKAIDIYKKCGFEPTDEKILYSRKEKNDYNKALKILEEIKERQFRECER